MERNTKHQLLMISFGVALFVGLMNLKSIIEFLGSFIDIIMPIVIGGILAFVLSVPMGLYEKLLNKLNTKLKKQMSLKIINTVSLILTLLSLIIVLSIVLLIVVPEITKSVNIIIEQFKIRWPEWKVILDSYGINTSKVMLWVENLNIKDIISKYGNDIGKFISDVAGTATSTFSVILTIAFSLITMFYILLFKKDIARQLKKVLYANVKREKVDKIIELGTSLKNTYTHFLTGQSIEALILGVLMFIALSIFGLSYAGLIAILTCVCAYIPYIGAFVSCGIGVFLTLLSSTQDAITCLIVYQCVQFIENQFIYPRVVGGYVGMSPLYTFLAVLIGGKLFGIVGILFFIPLTATLYSIARSNTNKRLSERNIDIS